MNEPPFVTLGPADAPILLVGDHASQTLPPGVDLGIDPALLADHVGGDIGVAQVARQIVAGGGDRFAAHLGRWSRLLVDLNRHEDDPAAVPAESDGHPIPGNALDPPAREERLARYFRPYHAALAARLAARRPALILSLHSFTPRLASRNEARPWPIAVLYGRTAAPSRAAIAWLTAHHDGPVGDQMPYSGLLLNATMDRHAEANAIPYVGIEMRQDRVADAEGQALYATLLRRMCMEIAAGLS
jgi:predicted N-formylglutamate amidohydrolase